MNRTERKQTEQKLWVGEPIGNIDCDLYNLMLCPLLTLLSFLQFSLRSRSQVDNEMKKCQTEFSF